MIPRCKGLHRKFFLSVQDLLTYTTPVHCRIFSYVFMNEQRFISQNLIIMKAISPDNFVDAPWHLALCRPNQNHIAFRNLTKAGFPAFMPRHHTSRRWRGRQIDGLRPVFGGYLFFSTDPAAPRWHEVTRMPGIGSLVKTSPQNIGCVPSSVVTGLMLRCDADGCLMPEDDFRQGEVLRMTCGPFAGFVGTVEKIDQDSRVYLLLDMLGRKTTVTVSHVAVERPT